MPLKPIKYIPIQILMGQDLYFVRGLDLYTWKKILQKNLKKQSRVLLLNQVRCFELYSSIKRRVLLLIDRAATCECIEHYFLYPGN